MQSITLKVPVTNLLLAWALVVSGLLACVAQNTTITAPRAATLARDWVGSDKAAILGPARFSTGRLSHAGPAWDVDLDTSDGWRHSVQLDGVTGVVISYSRYRVERPDSATEPDPLVTLEESRRVADEFAGSRLATFEPGRWIPALGSPRKGQMSYQWAWYEILDPISGAVASSELFLEVSDQTPVVITFWRPPQAPINVSTRPGVSRAHMLSIARRFALLDPVRYPVNHLILRVAMDDYGGQRLVWECLQVLDVSPETGVSMYGVVHDANTGEPLYPIAPFINDGRPRRPIRFPQRAAVILAPSGKPIVTQLVPPALDGGVLWVRAEHLRAMDGVHVDVDRNGVRVRSGDRTFTGDRLQARRRDGAWWVPLRSAARTLGWSVTWNAARKEATVHTGP